MKLTNKLLVSLASGLLVIATGCARLTPQDAALLTTSAVYGFGQNNPKLVTTMRQIQPLACDAAKNPGGTVEDVVGVIQNAGNVDADTKAILNVLLAIYQTSIAPSHTNQSEAHPYLEAIICPGWAGGLALLPGGTNAASLKGVPAPGNWILVK